MIYFIILHYMVEKETEKCVDSILKLDGSKKIVIVDNCSPNDSFNKLNEYYINNKDVILLQTSENLGFANGNNFGFNYVKENFTDVDFIVAMNNDMEINQNDFCEKIYELYEQDKFFVLAPDVYSTSNKIHQNPEVRTIRTKEKILKELEHMKRITKKQLYIKAFLKKIPFLEKIVKSIKNRKIKNQAGYLEKQYNKTLHGSCLIFSRDFIDNRKYVFYPETKFYCEAQILDYECEKNSWLRVYSPEIKVLHHEDVATNATYKSYVKKSIFMNNCMCKSLEAFKNLIDEDMKESKK